MGSDKLGRGDDEIQVPLSSILRNIKDPRVNQGLISITRVEATGDLRYAKVYISVLGLRDAKEFMKGLRSAAGYIRRELAGSLSLRYTPELVFELDTSIEHGSHINEIISRLEQEEQNG